MTDCWDIRSHRLQHLKIIDNIKAPDSSSPFVLVRRTLITKKALLGWKILWGRHISKENSKRKHTMLCLCVKERFTSKQFLFSCFFLFSAFFWWEQNSLKTFLFWVNRLMPFPRVESSQWIKFNSLNSCLTSDLCWMDTTVPK